MRTRLEVPPDAPACDLFDPPAQRPGRPAIPSTVILPPRMLRQVRLIVASVVFGPAIGSLFALGIAIDHGGVSGAALICFVAGYVATMLGITLGFHRHFTHLAFRTGRTVKLILIILGSAAIQGSLLYWVATHRRHHQFSDTADDPHSPHFAGSGGFWRSLLHGHVGWMFASEISNAMRFAPDLLRDRFVFNMARRYALWAILTLLLPIPIAALDTHDLRATIEIFLWAGPVRLLAVHHASWCVTSFSHMWGRRPFVTGDRSANNLIVALLTFGEGLQNNHHAFPRAAHHAHRWWEPDLTGYILDALAALGIVWDVQRATARQVQARRVVANPMQEMSE